MSFENLITLIFIVGMGYMMFRGGGCCGSHGGHKKHHEDEKHEKPEIGPGENKLESK